MNVTLVILNYNTPDLVREAVASIYAHHLHQSKIETKVIVVDNGSADRSLHHIKEEFPFLEIIELEKNLGFAAGNNVALRLVKTEYVMLLNSDTQFTAATHLDKMLAYMESHPKVAVMTPRLNLSDGHLDWASHRGEPTPWASLTYFTKLEKALPFIPVFGQYHQTYKNLSHTHFIDACSGAAMLVRTSAINTVGLLDEQFFMYAEDLDWCKRFREAGYSIVYFPESVIIHHKYQSGLANKNNKVVKKTSAHFYDTMLQYYDKHYRNKYPSFFRSFIIKFINFKKGVV